jgi:hypothetical protein
MILWLYRKEINNRTSNRFAPDKTDSIAMLWAVVLGLTIFSLSDKAITLGNVIPYGMVWTWMNPYYWITNLYKWVVLGGQLLVMVPMYYLAKKGKLNWTMLHLLLFTTIYFRLMGVFQEVSAVLFAPLATLNPVFSLILLVQKIPFWSFPPTLTDPHYLCSGLGQCVGYTVDRVIFLHGALNPDIATHFVIAFWLIAPIYVWWKRRQQWIWSKNCYTGGKAYWTRRKNDWNESRFWMKMMFPLSAIMMFGFFVIMFYGCCAGYHWFS